MYKPQKEFPYLQEFSKFPIDENTVFCLRRAAYADEVYFNGSGNDTIVIDTIYADKELPPDIEVHELKHLERQGNNSDEWIKKYLADNKFRLDEEILAFKSQLNSIKDRNERNEVRIKAAESLSGKLYGEIITYAEALKKLC